MTEFLYEFQDNACLSILHKIQICLNKISMKKGTRGKAAT